MVQSSADMTPELSMAILRESPAGVILVDAQGHIQLANPAFRRLFRCEDQSLLGKPAADILQSDCFARAAKAGGRLQEKHKLAAIELSCRIHIYPAGPGLLCGVFSDATEEDEARRRYRELRAQTLVRTQQAIAREMRTTQDISRLLGEATTENKTLLTKLMDLFNEELTQR